MKKIWAGILVLLASAALASVEITVGVKGTLSVSGNTWAKDVEESLRAVRAALKTVGFKSERPGAIVGGGGSVFFRWGFPLATPTPSSCRKRKGLQAPCAIFPACFRHSRHLFSWAKILETPHKASTNEFHVIVGLEPTIFFFAT